MGILWPHSNTVARTNADRRAPGALAYFFEARTTTPRPTYQDADLTTPHAHPVVADAHGRFPAVFIDFGSYRERVKTAGNTQLWDTDDIPNPAPTDPAEGVTADSPLLLQTGEVFFKFANGIRNGAVRANGRQIGNVNSLADERANTDTFDLYEELYNSLDNTVCPVLSNGLPTTRGANAAADFAANKTLTLPDLRGRSPVGLDTMGAVAASLRLASPVAGSADKDKPGYAVGANTHTLLTAELAAHSHAGSTADSGGVHAHALSGGSATAATGGAGSHTHTGSTSSNGAHTHTVSGWSAGPVTATGSQVSLDLTGSGGGGVAFANTDSQGAHTHSLTSVSDPGNHTHLLSGNTDGAGAHTHTLTITSAGSGTAHNNVPSAVLGTWYIKL